MARKRTYTRHGLGAVKAVVSLRGLKALDQRTAPVRAVMETRKAIADELGGETNLTAQESVVVDAIARELLFLNHVDSYVMAQESVLIGRGKSKRLLPVFQDRGYILKRLTSLLQLIGLARRARPVPSLQEYLASRADAEHDPPKDADGGGRA